MSKRRERIIVDCYYDETGRTFYRLIKEDDHEMFPSGCGTSGFFVFEDDLDEWLEENKSRVVVVHDYRNPD